MKWLARSKAEQNRAAVDPWTLVHLAAGLAAGLVRIPFAWALGLAVGYEALEQVLERQEAGQELLETSGPESLPNSLIDLAVFAAGHDLGRRWNRSGEVGPEEGAGGS